MYKSILKDQMFKLLMFVLRWSASVELVCLCSSPFFFVGMDNSSVGNSGMVTEAGWYILGEDQQHVGPYAFSELRGEL